MLLSHFLIGVPGSGKSTLAQQLVKLGNYQIISSDRLREQLYGDETVLGNWLEIETEIIKQIAKAMNSSTPVIYDATNAKRAWRLEFLQKLETKLGKPINWLAWYLKLDLDICKRQNSQRQRQVPEEIIEQMADYLLHFPPHVAEGFIDVKILKTPQELNPKNLQKQINSLSRTLINRQNRTQHQKIVYHRYSKLLDFERLMHLISLIVNYPNLGNLEFACPEVLESIFGQKVTFGEEVAEITAMMAKLKGNIYANSELIKQDLEFLDTHLNSDSLIEVEAVKYEQIITHYASDKTTFERLLNTIKTIATYPFIPKLDPDYLESLPYGQKIGNGYLTSLALQLIIKENLPESELKSRRDVLRKDIEFIFNPYQVFPRGHMRNGYYLGTGILTKGELKQIWDLLKAQAKNIEDPLAVEIAQKLENRIKWSNFSEDYIYPVRAIANRSFIDTDLLDATALSQKEKIEQITELIEKRQLVRLGKFRNRPSYKQGVKGTFEAWLLQITFYNFAWYLGFEYHGGEQDGLFCFERLDRLFLDREQNKTRTLKTQKQALNKLTKLLAASTGIYLGNDVKAQKAFLSPDKHQRQAVETTVELWFSENIFAFIAEGTKRFPSGKMKMSKPPQSSHHLSQSKSLFSLSKSRDPNKPYRLQVILPQWSLNEFDFLRWILGFGGEVKVHKPEELRDKIINLSRNTLSVYRSESE